MTKSEWRKIAVALYDGAIHPLKTGTYSITQLNDANEALKRIETALNYIKHAEESSRE
jgi:hypothetical protein